ncbi:hypothetical protein STRUR_2253 [Streptococcus urinalis 2285-97]|uniref:Uncharacterized protein n=1 Tax=Streptococcus urinalis 2285-97 TaxID=764291 RepID=G5KFI7_9STRE|nr:hypothetical protein STRUR_2253 [Streptococcus urinalis 2285-97]
MGTTHHDGELVLLSLVSHNICEILKVTTDNVVSLFVEVTVGSVHHVSRRQTVVHPLALLTKRLRNRTRESHHIVTRFLLNLKNAIHFKIGIGTNLSHIFFRNLTQLSPCLVSQNLDLQPSTVFIFLTPNVRHLRT